MEARLNQMELFPTEQDPRPPESVSWNLWHGCTKVSEGCRHCYMFRRDEAVGRDPAVVTKTQSYSLPIRILRAGEHRGRYKIPSGSCFYTCFSSDFFHPAADGWRPEAWDMMRTRADCTFFFITKRPERIAGALPPDWEDGWEHVTIAVTCENQAMADRRLPVYLALPLCRRSVMIEPMLSRMDLRRYLETGRIAEVSVGGESGPDARICDFDWVLDVRRQCVEYGVGFSYHQTGAKLLKDGRLYEIPRSRQHEQAKKAGLDVPGTRSRFVLHGDMPGE